MSIFNIQTHYIFRSIWQDFTKRKFATVLTILVIAVSLTIPTVGYLLWKNTRLAVSQFYPDPELTLYLHKNLSEHDINGVVENLRRFEADKIERFHYISRQQSMDEFRSWSAALSNALDILDDNPLPAVVVLKPKKAFSSAEQMMAFRESLQQIKGVQDVRLDNDWIAKLSAINQLIAKIALTATFLMLFSVFLVIGNSVRSDVASHKATIEVMQLLGATDYFISRPFIYTAMLYGLFGGLLAILFSSLTVSYFTDIVRYITDMFTVQFELKGFNVSEITLIIVIAVFLGWLSALLATNRNIQKFGGRN